MPCLIDLIIYITEMKEVPTNEHFVMNAVGISKSSTREELVAHVIAFYQRNPDIKTNLERIEINRFVRVARKFILDDTDTNLDHLTVIFLKIIDFFFFKQYFPSRCATAMDSYKKDEMNISIKINSYEY